MKPQRNPAVRCSAWLGGGLSALQRVRHRLRDEECELRKQADKWHNLGAEETATANRHAANVLNSAVSVIVKLEVEIIAERDEPPNGNEIR